MSTTPPITFGALPPIDDLQKSENDRARREFDNVLRTDLRIVEERQRRDDQQRQDERERQRREAEERVAARRLEARRLADDASQESVDRSRAAAGRQAQDRAARQRLVGRAPAWRDGAGLSAREEARQVLVPGQRREALASQPLVPQDNPLQRDTASHWGPFGRQSPLPTSRPSGWGPLAVPVASPAPRASGGLASLPPAIARDRAEIEGTDAGEQPEIALAAARRPSRFDGLFGERPSFPWSFTASAFPASPASRSAFRLGALSGVAPAPGMSFEPLSGTSPGFVRLSATIPQEVARRVESFLRSGVLDRAPFRFEAPDPFVGAQEPALAYARR